MTRFPPSRDPSRKYGAVSAAQAVDRRGYLKLTRKGAVR